LGGCENHGRKGIIKKAKELGGMSSTIGRAEAAGKNTNPIVLSHSREAALENGRKDGQSYESEKRRGDLKKGGRQVLTCWVGHFSGQKKGIGPKKRETARTKNKSKHQGNRSS